MASTHSRAALPLALCVLLVALTSCRASPSSTTLSHKECEKLGFTGLQACSDCASMSEYVKDEELLADCQRCCVKTADDTIKYSSATLEVCPFRLTGLPAIKDFIDKHAKTYGKALKVSEVMGAYPKLILKDKKSGASKNVRIDQWKVPTIHEFLKDKLDLSSSASSSGASSSSSKNASKKKKKAPATATS